MIESEVWIIKFRTKERIIDSQNGLLEKCQNFKIATMNPFKRSETMDARIIIIDCVESRTKMVWPGPENARY